jgi:dipeptidyl aminopeptidase/acylaminoacyl peptidase
MAPKRFTVTTSRRLSASLTQLLLALLLVCLSSTILTPALAQETSPKAEDKKPAKSEVPEARAKGGKKLLSSLDLMKVAGVGGAKLSPDGTRIAYTVSETKMEKDKEWKSVTQVWVVPVNGGKSRQYTRGEKSATAPEWSPDGQRIAFLSDREKDGERQVWMMMSDGGEAWAVTTHKGGVSGFKFSPDGKLLLLSAADQPSKDEEERKKVKDDTLVIDRDLKMTHLWRWTSRRKRRRG